MDEDVDFSSWQLPPLEDDPDREPPPEREYPGGVWLGSDLAGVQHAGGGVLDLGDFVCNNLASVRPTVVGLAELGSTDFGALSQKERVDALLVIEQHRAWLDGLQQQLLAQVAFGDPSADKWIKEEVACALGLAPQTARAKLKNAEQLCSRLPATLGLLLDGRISELQARAVTEASYVLPDEILPAYEDRVLKRAPEHASTHRLWIPDLTTNTLLLHRTGHSLPDIQAKIIYTDDLTPPRRDGLAGRAAAGRARPRLPAEDRRRRPDGTHRGRAHPRAAPRRHPH